MFNDISLSTCVLLFLLCVLIHWWIFKRGRYSPTLPPSPGVKLPLIGHLHLLKRDMREPLRQFRRKCGDVYTIQFGSKLGVVIAGYGAMKEAFKTNGDQFPLRPKMWLLTRLSKDMGLVVPNGPAWQEHRRFTLKTLKDFGMGKSKLEDKIHTEAAEFLKQIESNGGKPFNPKELISAHVASIISSMAFGASFQHTDSRFQGMIQMFDENLKSAAGIANFLPWMAKLPGDPLRISKNIQNSDMVFEYCNSIVEEHIQSYDENNVNDLTSAYIKEVKLLEKSGESTTMSYKFLACVIADLFIAGSETTTTTLRWSLVCLVNFPDIQEKLYREIEGKIGTSRLPSVQDRTLLKYVEAFYMEVLRYCNLTVFGLFHAPPEDVVFRGFTIPADAVVVPDLDSIFTDPEIWGDPEVFRPERFFDEEGNLEKKDEFLAFFFGKRSCIGESLARMELFIFISSLVQRFKFESSEEEQITVAGVDGEFGAVHAPKPYQIVAKSRK